MPEITASTPLQGRGGMPLNEMAAAGEAFQKLPCLEYVDILGNILYAGVWNRYDDIQAEREGSPF